ncbi:MAG: CoA pyrophosphatase [Calditrichaeota bacterium]|nr:MAG: CoA pyrophosphatase [Calditrichota bacterium]
MLLTPEDIQKILQTVPKRKERIPDYTPAAVMMIFLNKNQATHLVYIRRTRGMSLHSGQMAFPGGKIDLEDDTSLTTAIRETYEEIGISSKEYQYLGDMGYFHTLTSRYDAAAHLAWSPGPLRYRINSREVAEIVEIPVQILMSQFRSDLNEDDLNELMYLNFQYQPEGSSKNYTLWGLTARITHHFLKGLKKQREL